MSQSGVGQLHVERSAPADRPAGELPLVMLHGWGMNLRVFDRLREDLACETLAIDLPGHGRSPWWPEASAFDVQCDAMRAALPSRCVLVGWSLGAKFALSLAASEPRRVAAVVLLSSSPRFLRGEDWPQGSDPAALAALRAGLEQDWRQVLDDFVWLQVRGSREADATARELAGMLAAHGMPQLPALRAGLDLLGQVDLRSIVPTIDQPALVVTGLNDRVTLPDASRWLAARLPHAHLLELPRAGHAPFISHHAQVATAIREFLAPIAALATAAAPASE
jgi:pimeloyl-[acyl-carrier protein] methyl ester esterase